MRILGIETSCDETAAAVVEDGARILSNVVSTQHDLHGRFGGVVPEIACRAHIENVLPVVIQALEDADTGLDELEAVAVTTTPGLIGALLVGVTAAKALSWSLRPTKLGLTWLASKAGRTKLPTFGMLIGASSLPLKFRKTVC